MPSSRKNAPDMASSKCCPVWRRVWAKRFFRAVTRGAAFTNCGRAPTTVRTRSIAKAYLGASPESPAQPVDSLSVRITITGVAGFVGSNLTERLLKRGDTVRGIDDLSHGTLENLGASLNHPSFRLDQGTILDPAALRASFEGAEVVVHLAAGKIPRHGDDLDTLLINGEGGLNVLRAVQECGVRRIVLASTSDCYGRNPAVPFDEESASVIGSPK